MTIAAGFRCKDGVVLAADTEISVLGGTGKSYSSKMFEINSGLGSHLTYSGSPDFTKELVQELKQSVAGKPQQSALQALKETYRDYYDAQLPDSDRDTTSMLITLREGKKVHLYVARNRHFAPVRQYEALGIGSEQGEALFNPLHSQWMSTAEAKYMAIYALRRVKGFVQGCGGKTEVIEIGDKADVLSLYEVMQEIKEIEADFDFFDQQLRPILFTFSDLWVNKSAFQARLRQFGRALKKRRAASVRAYEKDMAEWAKIVRESKEG